MRGFDSNTFLGKPVSGWVGGRQPVLREAGSHRSLYGRPRLNFREDVFTMRPAEGTSRQHFQDSMSTSFKAEHLHFAGPLKSDDGFLRQNLERDNVFTTIAGGTFFLLSPVLY